jgi:beta-glucosidase
MLTSGNRRTPHRWALWVAVLFAAAAYIGCSSRPPANKVTEAGENGGNGTSGASSTVNGGTGTGATGATGVGGTPPGGGMGNGGTPPGGGMGADAGVGNVPGGGMGGMIPENDPSCREGFPPQEDPAFQRYRILVDDNADAVSKHTTMQPAEKLAILSGGSTCSYSDGTCFQALGVSRAAVNYPTFKMRDGPRGVRGVVGEKSTTFSVAMARGASWDLDLERRIGQVMAVELRALRSDILLAPTINVLRHPGWARAQETYGEDPVHVGEMGAAFVRGMQDGAQGMPACPKHFAGNNTDENRGGGPLRGANMIVDEQTLRENYLRHFQIVVEKSDPACIMAAYNDLNGTPCAEHPHLLTEVLRSAPSSAQRGWGWTGFVVSDWGATLGAGRGAASINAGLDVEMPTDDSFGDSNMPTAAIDVAARRVLNVRGTFRQLTNAYIMEHGTAQNTGISDTQAHKDLARESAEKGSVLLKNNGVLPLGKTIGTMGTAAVPSIVVLGPDRAKPVTDTTTGAHGLGDRGSSNTNPPYTVTFVQGIMTRAMGSTVTNSANAADAAGKTVAIIPVTMAHGDEGENYDSNGAGGDRDTLTLSSQEPRHWSQKPTAFINAARAADPNVKIVVLLAFGSAVVMEDWMSSADAIVQTFYPGQEAGTAVARLLFGDVNFQAKLPFTVAQDPAHYPAFGNTAASVNFDYLHGYRRFDANNTPPRFFFGFGLSYTTYTYSNLRVLCPMGITATGRLNVEVTVTNTGMMTGDEVVQLYVGYPAATGRMHPSPPKELKAWTKVHLEPGASQVVPLTVPARDLRHWGSNGWQLDPGAHTVYVGPSADPATLQSAMFTVN